MILSSKNQEITLTEVLRGRCFLAWLTPHDARSSHWGIQELIFARGTLQTKLNNFEEEIVTSYMW